MYAQYTSITRWFPIEQTKESHDFFLSIKSSAFDIEIFVDILCESRSQIISVETLEHVIDDIRKRVGSQHGFPPVTSTGRAIFTVFSRYSTYVCAYVSSARLWPTTSVIAPTMIADRTFPLADLRECQNVRLYRQASVKLSILVWHLQPSIIGCVDDRCWLYRSMHSHIYNGMNNIDWILKIGGVTLLFANCNRI